MSPQRISPLCFLVGAAAYGWAALGLEATTGLSSSRMGPSAFPVGLAIVGMLVAAWLVARPGADAPDLGGDHRRVVLIVAVTILYAVGLPTLGFFLSTTLFLAAALVTLDERRPAFVAGVPLGTALASSLLLRVLLGVWLPEPILRWLGLGP
ncbi:MAG: tripartite tricarboxylate transporter TctB family protein [Acidobacteriota bacterium]|nr:tripartite tricarboxylate transporter TctB family protein [Acidobacteriota bacterium]